MRRLRDSDGALKVDLERRVESRRLKESLRRVKKRETCFACYDKRVLQARKDWLGNLKGEKKRSSES